MCGNYVYDIVLPFRRKHISEFGTDSKFMSTFNSNNSRKNTHTHTQIRPFFFKVLTDCIILMKICGRVLQARKSLRGKGIMRQSCEMPNHNYPKALAVHCNYSVTRLLKNIWNGGRHLELCWKWTNGELERQDDKGT